MRKDSKKYRREKASKRKEERKNRNPKEQLRLLDERLGKGIGALKERKRLTQILKEDSKNGT